jgi:hypothetical protein
VETSNPTQFLFETWVWKSIARNIYTFYGGVEEEISFTGKRAELSTETQPEFQSNMLPISLSLKIIPS